MSGATASGSTPEFGGPLSAASAAAPSAAVRLVQERLSALGYSGADGAPLKADGCFGRNTLHAVNRFKTRSRLGNAGSAAGVVGRQTWEALFASTAVREERVSRERIYYSQEDPRWRNVPYTIGGKETIGSSGCGPTCMAMAVASLTRARPLPTELAAFSVKGGHRTRASGTSWSFFPAASREYGLACKATGSIDEARAALQRGDVAIASMKPGRFTSAGHFILLAEPARTAAGEPGFLVFDPNPDNRLYRGAVDEGVPDDGRVTAPEALLRQEAKQFWLLAAVPAG
ncbi:C39 family peptidase [Paenibacillus pasadenensis]|uniref:C39 family peptidase n=1 Tax=Paenibacillus TaxID=44249 RepID=UPI00040A03F2|nr:C39 family peptidase [Paenibacillus pasadenensis]